MKAMGNHIDAISSLIHGILDQRESAELTRDEEVWYGGFVFRAEDRQVGTRAWLRHLHGDGAYRTLFGAKSMSDAFVCIHDCGFPVDDGKHIAFRASRNTGATTDALIAVDVWVLRSGPFRGDRPMLDLFASARLLALMIAPIAKHEERQHRTGDHPCQQSLHRLAHPQSAEAEAHNYGDVKHCK